MAKKQPRKKQLRLKVAPCDTDISVDIMPGDKGEQMKEMLRPFFTRLPMKFTVEIEGFHPAVKWHGFNLFIPYVSQGEFDRGILPGNIIASKIDVALNINKRISLESGETLDAWNLMENAAVLINLLHSHKLTKTEYLNLLKYWPDTSKEPDPQIYDYFGGFLKKILEGIGYAVTIKISDEPLFPIARIDRTTIQDFFPILINKGIFTNYTTLPSEDDVLEKEKKRLKKIDLSFTEKRQALNKAGEYQARGYVMRDYGDYAIGFSSKLYIDYLEQSEEELIQAWRNPSLFADENKAVEDALKKIRLYKLAHKLAYITLTEVFQQKTYKGVIIPKQKIIETYLGYSTNDKQIYQDIKESYLSLRWLDYKLFDYSYTETKKKRTKARGKAVGNFIYNIGETQKHFTLDVNEKFVGCVQYLWGEKIQSRKERRQLFGRGYINYVTRALPLTKSYSTSAYLLNDFLIRDSGNKHHKKKGLKAVVYKGSRYIEEAHITHKRANRRWETFLKAIAEVDIIKEMDPPISELKTLKPSQGLKNQIIMYVTTPPKALDQEIKHIIQQKK